MDKVKVYELAKELEISSKDLIILLDKEFDIHVKNHMSQVEEDYLELIRPFFNKEKCKDITLSRMILKNIKQFKENNFDFTNSSSINTISGRNGSGKSTLFKCLTFVQKAFFIELFKEQDNYHSLRLSLGKELFSFFNGTDSYIEVEFKKEYDNLKEIDGGSENHIAVIGLAVESISNEIIDWKLVCSDRDYRVINKFWNLSNPKKIIIYIESFKNIVEEDVKYDSINIRYEKRNYSTIVDIILNQDEIYNQLYKSLVNDYLYYRLVPPEADERRDIYYYITKVLFKHIFANIDLKNFSGKTRSEQFILLAGNGNKELFDIRNFSSGEKLVFYLLLFINYVKSLGILIIDEMENHLHEEVASKFLATLSEICRVDNYGDYIIKKNRALKNTSKQEEILKRNIYTTYNNFVVKQIFLLTHSKSLIYANFGEGKNFILRDGLEVLNDNCEKELRDIGISYIYDKVVFVEGKTDCDILSDKLSPFNIKVKKLGNCTEVINTFKKLLNTKEFTRDSKYVFLIDKDSRGEEEIENLRKINVEYFDDAFICLDRHEMENYFLDEKAILTVISKFNDQLEIDEEVIKKDLYEIACENKYASKRKYLNYYIEMKLESLRCLVNMRDIDRDASEKMDDYLKYINNKIINSSSLKNLDKELIKIYEDCSEKYSDEVWNIQWRSLCDGKIVFNHYTSKYARTVGLTNEYFRKNIMKEVINDNESEFNKLVNSIIKKFL